MLRRTDFEKLQRTTGFNLDLLEKAYNLTRVLQAIQNHDIMKINLSLKGGTALNFLYLDLPRLSIDIDFNYIGKIAKEDMLETRPVVENHIKTIGEKLGYETKIKGQSYILSRHSLKYTTIRNTKDHIKIEINYLDRLPIADLVIKKFPSIFPDIFTFPVTTYSLEEIAAQKIKACIERTEPRDIFDLYCLSKQNLELDKARKIAAVYYCMCNKKINKEILKKKEEYDLAKLEQELQQFVRDSEKFDAKTIRQSAADFLKQILSFTSSEQDFIDTFFNKKKIVPELLFPNKSMIKQHPALLKKLKKMRKLK
ncbi:MAG: nucleotidyl transferase AbiEii/AbiGii toxin family protein [Thermoplasmata archaeon]|nr:nucleotidyl transferase AbiEii/AbiGii toxin family protein [Thermoplasmata archaeon]